MGKKRIKLIVFRPWNILLIPVMAGLAFLIHNVMTHFIIPLPELPEQYRSVAPTAFYLILAACFGCGALYITTRFINYWRSSEWQKAPATVIYSKIHMTEDNEGAYYEPVIKYRYSTGARDYTSDRIYVHSVYRSSFPFFAERPVSRYREGMTITVFYNRSKPEVSCIERAEWGWLPAMSAAFLFMAVMFLFFLALSLGIIEL